MPLPAVVTEWSKALSQVQAEIMSYVPGSNVARGRIIPVNKIILIICYGPYSAVDFVLIKLSNLINIYTFLRPDLFKFD